MLSFRKLRTVCTALVCVFAVCAAVCLYLALQTDYDPRLRLFESDSAPAAAAAVLCVLGAAAAGVFALYTLCSRSKAAPRADGNVLVFFSSLLGFLLFAAFIVRIGSFGDAAVGTSDILDRVRLALMGLSAFYFLAAVTQKGSISPITALLSLAPILYAFLSVMHVYFDSAYSMNAPVKLYGLLMYLSLALFFTAETRALLGRLHLPAYCLFAGLCIALCGPVSLSRLAIAVYDAQGFGFSLLESAVLCAAAVFAAVRLFTLCEQPEESSLSAPEETAE